jgi:hypothetical protein
VELEDVRFRREALVVAPLPQRIHDVGDVDVVGTTSGAGLAGGTNPDGFGSEKFFLEPQLDHSHDLVGQDIHGKGHRTAVGALAALVAMGNFFTTAGFKYLKEFRVRPQGKIITHKESPFGFQSIKISAPVVLYD